jgi:LCP family protein required for cell wall assembly
VDFIGARIQTLTFQRDLYVEIPGIESHGGITHGKLNQAYFYGNLGYSDDPRLGPGLLALTLEQNFGAHADHYVAVNLQTFSHFIDALGGIDIRLPYVVDGRVKGSRDRNLYFPAGDQHLNGYRTMLLARMRPQGDLQRSEIQNLILQAIVEKLLSPTMFLKLSELNRVFRDSVQTDLEPVDVGRLICLSSMLDTKNIEYLHFPDKLFKSARVQDPVLGYTSVWDVDFDTLKTYVKLFEEGLWLEGDQ